MRASDFLDAPDNASTQGASVPRMKASEFLDAPDVPAQEGGTAYTRFVESNPVTRALVGAGGGLVKAGVGAIQGVAQAVGADETARAAGAVTKDINQTVSEGLGTSGKVGMISGEIAPYLAAPASAPTMVGRALLSGASGAAQGLLQAQETPDAGKRVKDAAIQGAIGLAAVPVIEKGAKIISGGGGAALEAAKTVKAGASARSVEELAQTGEVMRQNARETYQAARDAGAVLNRNAGVSIANKVEQAVQQAGKLNDKLHGDTISVLGQLGERVKQGNVSLEELDQFRQLLGDAVKKNSSKIDGVNADGMRAKVAIDALDDAVESLGKIDIRGGNKGAVELWQQARKQWSQMSKFNRISDIVERADGDANRLKAGLQRFVQNKNNLRGFSAQERKALIDAARNTTGELLLKTVGKFGFDLGGSMTAGNTAFPAIAGFVAGTTSSVGAGGGLVAAGTAARYLQKLVGRGKAENVLRIIEQGGAADDVAKAVSGEVGDKAAQALAVMISNTPNGEAKTLMQQAQDLITRSPTPSTPAVKAVGKGAKLNSRPEVGLAALGISGAGAAGVTAGGIEAGRQGYEADAAATTPVRRPDRPGMDRTQRDEIGDLIQSLPAQQVSSDIISKIARVESSNNPEAKARTSSALGLHQFTAKTWLDVLEKHEPELMVGMTKADLLRLRKNPEVSKRVAGYLVDDNASILENSGVPITDATIYLAHFAGAGKAVDLLKADPATPVARVVGSDVVRANRRVLGGKTVGQVLAWAERKMR